MSDWRHRRLKPPEGYPHEDWAAGVYLEKADEYIAELEAQLASLQQELGLCHRIIKHGVQSNEELVYFFDIKPDKAQEGE